jgi:hypothetical protein
MAAVEGKVESLSKSGKWTFSFSDCPCMYM